MVDLSTAQPVDRRRSRFFRAVRLQRVVRQHQTSTTASARHTTVTQLTNCLMEEPTMRQARVPSSFVLLLALILCLPLQAATASPEAAPTSVTQEDGLNSLEEQVEATLQDAVAERRQQILSEAFEALAQSEAAMRALDEGDTEAALDALAMVTGRLELIVAREPDLALAPVDVWISAHDLLTDREEVEALIEQAKRALDAGRVQEARDILAGLGSELVVEVQQIPLATYPDAIKAVTPLIDSGEIEAAKVLLQDTLNTLIATQHVIPLPLLRAELLLRRAQSIFTDENRTAVQAARLPELIEKAKKQLELAEVLSYGGEETHARLREELESVEDQILGGVRETGLFVDLLEQLGKLRRSVNT